MLCLSFEMGRWPRRYIDTDQIDARKDGQKRGRRVAAAGVNIIDGERKTDDNRELIAQKRRSGDAKAEKRKEKGWKRERRRLGCRGGAAR